MTEKDEALYSFDADYSLSGPVAGVDEVGRGPLAGPVVAAAVILPEGVRLTGLNDSKRLSPRRRQQLAEILRESGAIVGIGMVSHAEIDRINILAATLKAMSMAVSNLSRLPGVVLVDGSVLPRLQGVEARCIVGGDGRSASIAAASIAAKVYRDELMQRYDLVYPGYGFASNKGYGSAEHMRALAEIGPSPIHRRSFAPVREAAADIHPSPGQMAETAACEFLQKRGYFIRERNYRIRTAEIDIVAEKNGLIVFAEVKMRSQLYAGRPLEAVDARKQARLRRAAEAWLLRRAPDACGRFDVLEVLPRDGGYEVASHLEDAFS